MGAGAKWPGPEAVLENLKKPKVDTRKTPGGKQVVAVP